MLSGIKGVTHARYNSELLVRLPRPGKLLYLEFCVDGWILFAGLHHVVIVVVVGVGGGGAVAGLGVEHNLVPFADLLAIPREIKKGLQKHAQNNVLKGKYMNM